MSNKKMTKKWVALVFLSGLFDSAAYKRFEDEKPRIENFVRNWPIQFKVTLGQKSVM